MSSGLYQIEKLDDDNYDCWKVQMRSILIHSELWQYVSGGIPQPADAATDSTWTTKDGKALATILLLIKTSQVLHIKDCTTSKSAWEKLREVHSPRGPARKVTLFKRLLNLKMAENSSVVGHLNNIFDLFEKLKEVDIKMQDELLSIILLSSLPKSYENFVIAIESRDELPKPHTLKTKLIEEGKRREEDPVYVVHESGEAAFFSKQRSKNQPQSQPQSQQSAAQSQAQKQKRGKCYKCHKKGHYAASCRAAGSSKSTTQFAMLNAASRPNVHLTKSDWVLDSGTTSNEHTE